MGQCWSSWPSCILALVLFQDLPSPLLGVSICVWITVCRESSELNWLGKVILYVVHVIIPCRVRVFYPIPKVYPLPTSAVEAGPAAQQLQQPVGIHC